MPKEAAMKKLLPLFAGMTLAALLVIACGGDDIDSTDNGPSAGLGPGISIGDAIASDLDGPLLINGFLVIQGGEHDDPEEVRICEALAESFPPQCGGRFLVVEGLDLKSIEGLMSEGAVSWTDAFVQVLGKIEGEVLTVSATSQ